MTPAPQPQGFQPQGFKLDIIFLCLVAIFLIVVAGAAYRYGYSNGLEEGFNEGWVSRAPPDITFYNCSFTDETPTHFRGGGSGVTAGNLTIAHGGGKSWNVSDGVTIIDVYATDDRVKP